MLISDPIDFDMRNNKSYEDRHHLLIKRSILQEEITMIHVYVTNAREPCRVKQILIIFVMQ